MVGDGMKVDPERLRQMAAALHDSTGAAENAGCSAAPMPEVTSSNKNVSHTIAEIMKAVGALGEGVHRTADNIHASDGSYEDTDNHAASNFDFEIPKFSR